MVMDATQPQQPSPQSVGREFVRQYYTLLNKAPNHLHRFYNNNSSFIHGESTLVVGQKNIHNRIQQLNFHDCHAKISQVDAQATLGNGVVVQVTGELSNDGQPMRRFTQTFVLAAQSPKKYYVHNDIFRYQDLYSDEEVDGEPRSENDEDHEQQQVPQPLLGGGHAVVASPATAVVQANEQQAPVVGAVNEPQVLPNPVVAGSTAATGVLNQQAQTVYYPMPAAGGRPMAVLPPPPGAAPVPMAANFANTTAAGVAPQAVPAAGVTQLNGVVAHEELITNIQQPTVAQQPQLAAANQTPSPVLTPAAGTVSVGNATVLGAQTPSGVASVPVAVSASAATGLPQNPASAIPNYQQSPLMPTHILQQPQQQQQQQPQQQLPNTPSQMQQQPQTLLQQSQTPLSAGTNITDVEDTTINMSSNAPPSLTEQQQQQQQQPSRPNTAANVVASGQTVASSASTVLEPTPAPVVEDFKTINEQQQQEKYEAAKQQQQQQKTYANLFKSSSPNSFVKAAMQQQQQLQQQHQQQQQQQQQSVGSMYQQTNSSNISSSNTYSQSASSTSSTMPVYGNRNNDNSSSTMRQDNNNSQGSGGPLPQRSNAKGFSKDFEQRRTSNTQQFGDSQQLFLGNIPHHASEEELKALFSRFGQVVDLRILSKGSGKLPPGARNPLNYGFITYNDAEAVQNCLANCPLYFPDSADGQKLNVEEKKPRTRPNDMPPRQSMGGSGMNNMNNNQRNMSGGPPSRSLSNSGSGSMMRGNSVGNNTNSMSRGGSSSGGSGGPPRMGGAFNRNDNRPSNGGGSGGGSQMRGGNNNSQSQGNSYGVRR